MSKNKRPPQKKNVEGKPETKADAIATDRSVAMHRPSSNKIFLWVVFIGSIVGSMAVMAYFRTPPSVAPRLTYQRVESYPHDPEAFTQGLLLHNGMLYEGTGREGQSTLRLVDIVSGKPSVIRKLPDHYFGEGITIYGSKLYQLTFRNRKILIYDKDSLKLLEERDFPYDGWGLTSDSDYLIHSDGTSTIRFLDPETFKVVNKITVHEGRTKISEINELEYYDGRIYANVWHEDYILQIIPATGRVSARIELDGLLETPLDDREACLNGIAVDKESNTFYLTGKLWPKVYEVKIVEKNKVAAKRKAAK